MIYFTYKGTKFKISRDRKDGLYGYVIPALNWNHVEVFRSAKKAMLAAKKEIEIQIINGDLSFDF